MKTHTSAKQQAAIQASSTTNGNTLAALPRREWLRVNEACEYSRVSKPKLYDLINRGLIKSVALKERGQIKGTRLISFDSLKGFLESRATGGDAATTSQA